jgi:alpha-glucosidase
MPRKRPIGSGSTPLGRVHRYRITGGRATLAAAGGRAAIDFLEDGVVRVAAWIDEAGPPEHSWSVVRRDPEPRPLRQIAARGAPHLEFSAGATTVRIEGATGRIEIRDAAGRTLCAEAAGTAMARRGEGVRCWLDYPRGERSYGFGEKAGRLDKRGTALRMWNTAAFGFDRLSDPLYKSIPFWIGLRDGEAHGIFLDCPGRSSIDLGVLDEEILSFGVDQGPLDFYVIPGPHPKDVIRRYTALTGRPLIPPRWALGYHQCRYSYYPESRVRELAARFRERQIPCDVLHLDIHYMDGYRVFTWDPERFPAPEKLLADLHEQGFAVVAIVDPGLKAESGYEPHDEALRQAFLVQDASGEPLHGPVWPGDCVFPDFMREEVRSWWAKRIARLAATGLDGIWTDMNEPELMTELETFPGDARHHSDIGPRTHRELHNVYGQQMARATCEGLRELRPDRRPFVMTRAAFAGIQRWSACWSGDNDAGVEDLALSVTQALNMGVSGVPMYGPDIGGHAGGPTPELFARWLQVGAFFGLMRVHSMSGCPDQEPWSFGSFWEDCNRKSIERRYRLLPYLEALFREAHETGTPPMRPLWLEWPERGGLATVEDVFLLGPSLLVAPVLDPAALYRSIPLPPGSWYDFETGAPHSGGCEITVAAPYEHIPLLARAGAIIPLQEVVQSTASGMPEELELRVFLGAGGSFGIVEDPGDGAAGEEQLRTIAVQLTDDGGRAVIAIDAPEGSYPGHYRRLHIEIIGLAEAPSASRLQGADWGSWGARRSRLTGQLPIADLPAEIAIERAAGAEPLHASPGLEAPRLPSGVDPALGPEAWSELPGVVLDGVAHLRLHAGWSPRPLGLRLAAAWEPSRLHLLCVVTDPSGRAVEPPENIQEGDGITFAVAGGDDAASHEIRIDLAAEPPCCHRIVGEVSPDVETVMTRRGDAPGEAWYVLRIPAAQIGRESLAPEDEIRCDLLFQESTADRGRACIQWAAALRQRRHSRWASIRLV